MFVYYYYYYYSKSKFSNSDLISSPLFPFYFIFFRNCFIFSSSFSFIPLSFLKLSHRQRSFRQFFSDSVSNVEGSTSDLRHPTTSTHSFFIFFFFFAFSLWNFVFLCLPPSVLPGAQGVLGSNTWDRCLVSLVWDLHRSRSLLNRYVEPSLIASLPLLLIRIMEVPLLQSSLPKLPGLFGWVITRFPVFILFGSCNSAWITPESVFSDSFFFLIGIFRLFDLSCGFCGNFYGSKVHLLPGWGLGFLTLAGFLWTWMVVSFFPIELCRYTSFFFFFFLLLSFSNVVWFGIGCWKYRLCFFL